MGWFSRRAAEPAPTRPAAGAGPAVRAEPGWQSLPPLARTTTDLQPVAPLDSFSASLASYADPRFLSSLSHVVDPAGPSGRVYGLVEPAAPAALATTPSVQTATADLDLATRRRSWRPADLPVQRIVANEPPPLPRIDYREPNWPLPDGPAESTDTGVGPDEPLALADTMSRPGNGAEPTPVDEVPISGPPAPAGVEPTAEPTQAAAPGSSPAPLPLPLAPSSSLPTSGHYPPVTPVAPARPAPGTVSRSIESGTEGPTATRAPAVDADRGGRASADGHTESPVAPLPVAPLPAAALQPAPLYPEPFPPAHGTSNRAQVELPDPSSRRTPPTVSRAVEPAGTAAVPGPAAGPPAPLAAFPPAPAPAPGHHSPAPVAPATPLPVTGPVQRLGLGEPLTVPVPTRAATPNRSAAPRQSDAGPTTSPPTPGRVPSLPTATGPHPPTVVSRIAETESSASGSSTAPAPMITPDATIATTPPLPTVARPTLGVGATAQRRLGLGEPLSSHPAPPPATSAAPLERMPGSPAQPTAGATTVPASWRPATSAAPDAGSVAVGLGVAQRAADGSVVFAPAAPGPAAPAGRAAAASSAASSATVSRLAASTPLLAAPDRPARSAPPVVAPVTMSFAESEPAPVPDHPTVARAEDGAPSPSADPPPAAPGAPATTAAIPAGMDIDELVRRIYEPLSARIKSELRLDRERAGLVTDRRR